MNVRGSASRCSLRAGHMQQTSQPGSVLCAFVVAPCYVDKTSRSSGIVMMMLLLFLLQTTHPFHQVVSILIQEGFRVLLVYGYIRYVLARLQCD